MLYDGGDEASGCSTRGDNYFSSEDYLGIRIHGSTTHVDALSHGWKDQALYNGFSRDTINSFGAGRLGIENAPQFVTRGVLFDVARSKGVGHVDVDYEISVYYSDPDSYNQFAWPGLSIDAVRWLASQDAVLVGADNIGVEAAPPGFIQNGSQGHGILLRDYGIYILELLNLDELSTTGATEFLFMMAPLRIAGGTGSPVNPLAVI
jgi:kynurenine formamidase